MVDSGFLDKLSPRYCILADRGFLIAHEVNARGAFLKMPSFTKGKNNFQSKTLMNLDSWHALGSTSRG